MFNMGRQWKVFTENAIRFGMIGHQVFVYRDRADGKVDIVTNLIFTTVDEHDAYPLAEVQKFLPPEEAENFMQAFMDAAWEMGLRPKGMEDHRNELTATKYHLEDMRLLAKVKK